MLHANVRALVYVSDQQTIIIIIDLAIMHRVNHPQLQFHINDNYIVEIYVSMIHYPVIYDIDLTFENEKLVYNIGMRLK